MGDCISREAAVNALTKVALRVADRHSRTVATCINDIELLPAADVDLVRHGEWVEAGRGINVCSECNHGIRAHMACVNKYCPNCGAKMNLEDDNNEKSISR